MEKKKNWVKPRHKLAVKLVHLFFAPYVRWKYHIDVQPFPEEGKRPYLILMNHQTGYDQFFVGLTFRQPVYYVATEDIFSMGKLSDVIRFLVEPIPIKKQTTDIQAVKNCIRVAKEGGAICIAPEGNRTFHGKTVYMNPAIAGLAKKLGMPIAMFRIENGYGIQPRWSDVTRKGKMRSYVSRIVEPEEYAEMSNDELYELIQKELYVDEACSNGEEFHHKKNAEFLERAVYTCPWCGLAEFESNDDIIHCKSCGRQIRHLPTKELEGVNCEFPHRFVAEWMDWQEDFVNDLDTMAHCEAPAFEDSAALSLVHVYKYKELLRENASIRLYGDRIEVDEQCFHFDSVSVITVLGKNKLNIYSDNQVFQLKGSKRFNALKYVHFFHRYKNMMTGDKNGKFLGL